MAASLFDESEIKKEIIRVMRELYRRGLVSALGGNVSARIPGSEKIWITPSGVFKGELNDDDLIKIDLEGNVLEGFMRPSVEWPMHVKIYKVRPDVNAVVHAHNPVTTGLALAGIAPKPITVEAVVTLRKVPIVPFNFPGTEELAEAVGGYIQEGARALVLQNHGVVAVGYNLVEAEAIVETLEEVSTTMMAALIAGAKEPPLIPEHDMELAKKLYGI